MELFLPALQIPFTSDMAYELAFSFVILIKQENVQSKDYQQLQLLITQQIFERLLMLSDHWHEHDKMFQEAKLSN